MQLRLEKGLKERLAGKFGRYDFQVGILEDGPHKVPRRGARGQKGQDVLGTYAGGPVRKKSSKVGPLTIAQVSEANRSRMDVNYLTEPFKNKSSDIIQFTRTFFRLAFGKSEKKRAENLLQAIVRNPILRGEYGTNAALTKRIKGFDRFLIDTGQFFKAIRAACRIRGPRV